MYGWIQHKSKSNAQEWLHHEILLMDLFILLKGYKRCLSSLLVRWFSVKMHRTESDDMFDLQNSHDEN